jgi:hypothetical protein
VSDQVKAKPAQRVESRGPDATQLPHQPSPSGASVAKATPAPLPPDAAPASDDAVVIGTTRAPAELFDWAESSGVTTAPAFDVPGKPGYAEGIIRGTRYVPVFSEGKNWFTRGMSDAGNWIADEIASSLDALAHRPFTAGTNLPLGESGVNLSVGGGIKLLREGDISPSDPRRLAILELKAKYPGAIPVWVDFNSKAGVGYSPSHAIPLGPTGAFLRFGFSANAGVQIGMQRLMFVDINDPSRLAPSDAAGNRLQLSPFSAADMAKVEQGANFRVSGDATLRVDGAIGLGANVPALSEFVRVGASVEAGAYAALTGRFELTAEKVDAARTRITLSALGSAQTGVHLKAFAGVQANAERVGVLMRGFVDYIWSGGKPEAFENQLSNEEERRLLKDASGYMRLLVKNMAEGAGRASVETLINKYTSAYLEARAGIELSSRFSTSIDFELDSQTSVTLPRADMVPASMRGTTAANQPLTLRAGDVARLAYDMAVRGDLRLLQQLALIRNSGVRIVETTTETGTTTTASVKFAVPFIEFEDTHTSKDTVTNRYTPELGRMRTAVSEFSTRYHGIFGRTEETSAALRVHSGEDGKNAISFTGSDQNFSADFVVQNLAEPWTSYTEMQELTTVLDALSNGRLRKRTAEALASGRYRNDGVGDDINPIHQLFFKPREFGRSVVHLHIWLGEPGLRWLLESDLTREALLQRFGRLALSVADARTLTEELLGLRSLAKAAKTPEQEEQVAKRIRDFLQKTRERMPAYAALASLVPEHLRAVEMRMSSMVPGKTPIRFTYIQDGRASELLRVAGFAKMALDQYTRYQTILDPETRLRTAALLGEINRGLTAPSPDMYQLAIAENKLREEMARLDDQASKMQARLESDLGAARAFIDGLPDAKTIEAVLPTRVGSEVAILRVNALRAINAEPADVLFIRATIKAILAHMPCLRLITEVAPLVESTAKLANAMSKDDPALVSQAQTAVTEMRSAIETGSDVTAVLGRLRAVHQALTMKAGTLSDAAGVLETTAAKTKTDNKAVLSLAEQREQLAAQYKALAGDPNAATVSYFERAGVVPSSYMGTPYASAGEGVVTGAMVSDADLAMAAARPSHKLAPPPLSKDNVDRLATLVRQRDGKAFLQAATQLQFSPGDWVENPRTVVVQLLVKKMTDTDFDRLLKELPENRQTAFQRLRAEAFNVSELERDVAAVPMLTDDYAFLSALVKRDPKQMGFALDNLGYGVMVDRMYMNVVTRLDALSQLVSGDELLAMAKHMPSDDRKRLYALISSSDLRPQTRAKLTGAIVDDAFFFRAEEDLVASLVINMDAGDLRIFFDTLHKDGKLEQFLSAGSFWQILLTILTFGLARLFFHDNAAARRIVAAQGFNDDQINLEYGARKRAANAVERAVSDSLTKHILDTTPMDPGLRHGIQLAHDILGDVKYYDFAELPAEGKELLIAMGKGAGRQLVMRILDIAKTQAGSPSDMIAEYKRFFAGLTPEAIAATFKNGDINTTTSVIMKAVADGAIAGVIDEAMRGNKFITKQLILGIVDAMNELDTPIQFRQGGNDLRVDQAGYDALIAKWEFFRQYTGLDYSRVRVIYGGLAKAAGAVTFADTISIRPENAPMKDGKILLDEYFQQVIAFHESVHTVQQQIYGESVNAFIDQGIKMAGNGDRNGAYIVTEEMFDKATSIHDFREHWEQQAELLEQAFRMLWARRVAVGGNYESYPGGNPVLQVSDATISLTPERWEKMVRFVREFGDSSRRALGRTGGALTIQGIKPLTQR